MLGKFCLAFLAAVIGGIMRLDAQSTMGDSAGCESSTFDTEAVNLIREDLKDVKNLLGSNQRQCPPTESSNSKQNPASSLSSE